MEMNIQTQVQAMEMKTRAQSARDELQIGMNTRAWKNFDGDEQKKKPKGLDSLTWWKLECKQRRILEKRNL